MQTYRKSADAIAKLSPEQYRVTQQSGTELLSRRAQHRDPNRSEGDRAAGLYRRAIDLRDARQKQARLAHAHMSEIPVATLKTT